MLLLSSWTMTNPPGSFLRSPRGFQPLHFAGGVMPAPHRRTRGCASLVALATMDLTIFGQHLLDPYFIAGAYTVSLGTALILVLLERRLWTEAWQREFVKPETRSLYLSAVRANLLNYLVLAPAAKGVATAWMLSQGSYLPDFVSMAGLLACQAIGYALAHAWMHLPDNYQWTGHKYHHRFNDKTFVRPVSANATTWVEFLIAYAIPFVIGTALFRPSRVATDAVILAVSFANLCIHTPCDVLPMSWAPGFLVSNSKHFFHHEKDVTRFLSAPVLDLDWALGLKSRRKGEGKRKELPAPLVQHPQQDTKGEEG